MTFLTSTKHSPSQVSTSQSDYRRQSQDVLSLWWIQIWRHEFYKFKWTHHISQHQVTAFIRCGAWLRSECTAVQRQTQRVQWLWLSLLQCCLEPGSGVLFIFIRFCVGLKEWQICWQLRGLAKSDLIYTGAGPETWAAILSCLSPL